MSRAHVSRSFRIWPVGRDRDDDIGQTVAATTYSSRVHGPANGGRGAVHLEWGSGLTGNFTIQYTLKANPNDATDADWVVDSAATVIGDSLTVAGAAGKAILFIGNILPEWFRIKWTHTSGSGTVWAGARVEER